MQGNEYLPIGYKIGDHYEIIKVLGRDAFEIIYLVKDIYRSDYLVLKELFLEGSCFRDQESVYPQEKAKAQFEEVKAGVIDEVNLLKKAEEVNSVRTYGYLEANNTIYSIMEFINDVDISRYLKIVPQTPPEKIEIPVEEKATVKEPTEVSSPPKKSSIFLKMLIASLILFAGLAFYAHTIFQEEEKKAEEKSVTVSVVKPPLVINHPPLTDRTPPEPSVDKEPESPKASEPTPTATQPTPTVAADTKYISEAAAETSVADQEQIDVKIPPKNEPMSDAAMREFELIEESPQSATTIPASVPITKQPEHNNVLLGSYIGGGEAPRQVAQSSQPTSFNRQIIQNFLKHFVTTTEEKSLNNLVALYDDQVSRYFTLNHVTHADIYRDKQAYNQKWRYRNFQLLDFQILKTYTQNGIAYCDVSMRTRWQVATENRQSASGISKVFMTVKNTAKGLKVTSIYSLK